jgi:hypothetical protein
MFVSDLAVTVNLIPKTTEAVAASDLRVVVIASFGKGSG